MINVPEMGVTAIFPRFALDTSDFDTPFLFSWIRHRPPLTTPPPHTHSDLFAIPDFEVGAMENWGLITYRETAVLYDATSDPVTSKRRVATVIAHELAHQVHTL